MSSVSSEALQDICMLEWQILRLLQYRHNCLTPVVVSLCRKTVEPFEMAKLVADLESGLAANPFAKVFIQWILQTAGNGSEPPAAEVELAIMNQLEDSIRDP